MNFNSKLIYGMVITGAVFFTACDDEDEPGVQPAEVITATDIAVGAGPDYTFFDFESGTVLTKADSNSNKWDIAFAGTTIIVNGGVSGPGAGTAQIVDGIFDEIETAPADGFNADSEESLAIPSGSGNGWYNYTGPAGVPAHAILPIPGKVIVLTTGDGEYAKIEILSYYEGNPDTSSAEFAELTTRPASQFYTFRYAVAEGGGVEF